MKGIDGLEEALSSNLSEEASPLLFDALGFTSIVDDSVVVFEF